MSTTHTELLGKLTMENSATGVPAADLVNLRAGEFAPVVLLSDSLPEDDNAVDLVLSSSGPFKVGDGVVRLITVKMVDLVSGGIWDEERQRDETVDVELALGAVGVVKADLQVPDTSKRWFQDSTWSPLPRETTDSSEIGDLVQSFVPNNCFPVFSRHDNPRLVVPMSERKRQATTGSDFSGATLAA